MINKYPEYNIETLKILLYNSGDAKSREFLTTIPADAWATFSHVIDWYNPAHYDLTQWYLDNCHFPSMSSFPCILVGMPKSKTFSDIDEVILLEGKEGCSPTYKDFMDESDGALILSIVSAVMQTESYKLSHIRKAILLDSTIDIGCISVLSSAKTVEEIKIIYSRLAQEGKLKKNTEVITSIMEETGVSLNESISLNIPKEKVLMPRPNPPLLRLKEVGNGEV